MASIQSLGMHRPAGLQHAINELLLPADAPSSSYTWDITTDYQDGSHVEDELLVTTNCVIWSRGGIMQKTYRFELEKEPITRALLTWFPVSQEGQGLKLKGGTTNDHNQKDSSKPVLSKALVVFLKTQAHISFLSGTSHVVHMPFEVESACAAPQGVIIQRKQKQEALAPISLKFPRVPPNSFVSSQVTVMSPSSSQQNRFSIDGLGKPRSLPLRLSSTLENMWEPSFDQPESRWPRLVCLTDPLLELGLVVTQSDTSSADKRHRTPLKAPTFLEVSEEMLHIESVELAGLPIRQPGEPLVLAVTVNREAGTYSVWRLTYIKKQDPFINRTKSDRISKAARRRSSMQPSFASGATSPIQPSFRESFGAPLPGKKTRKSEKIDKVEKPSKVIDFASSLDPEKEVGTTRRQSRRVSSMLARADLSASQDRSIFSDQSLIPHTASKRIDSHGSQHGRASGAFGAMGFSQTIHPSLGSLLNAPIDPVLEELRAGGDFGFHNMDLDDHEFDGLSQEMLFTKIHTFPVENSNVRYSLSSKPAQGQCKVFILAAPQFAIDEQDKSQLLIGIQDPVEKKLQLLALDVQLQPKFDPSIPVGKKPTIPNDDDIVIRPAQLRRAQNVTDSCKISEGGISMILILSESMDGHRELSVQAPWSALTSITLPILYLDNTRSLQFQGRAIDRDVRQKKSEMLDFSNSTIAGIHYSTREGLVDVVDTEDRYHQLKIQLEPSNPQVRKILDVFRAVLPTAYGEKMVAGWWHVMSWLKEEEIKTFDLEWSSLVTEVFATFLALGNAERVTQNTARSSRRKKRVSGSFGSVKDLEDWATLQQYETPNSLGYPVWMQNRGWQWAIDDDIGNLSSTSDNASPNDRRFVPSHIQHTIRFLSSQAGEAALGAGGFLPTATTNSLDGRRDSAWNMFIALHLFLEEQKLDITTAEYTSPGSADLRVVMCQISRWFGWHEFTSLYELGMQEELDARYDSGEILDQFFSSYSTSSY
jgi:anaphase-promoting complex subunit 1